MTTATATKITANKTHPKLPVTPRRNAHFIDGAWVEGDKLIGQARAEMGGAADTWDYAAGLARTLRE